MNKTQIAQLKELRRLLTMQTCSFTDPSMSGGRADISGTDSRYADCGDWTQRSKAFTSDVVNLTTTRRETHIFPLLDTLIASSNKGCSKVMKSCEYRSGVTYDPTCEFTAYLIDIDYLTVSPEQTLRWTQRAKNVYDPNLF